ncbi:hypothetical protein FB451DRAFT_1313450 [Mycena latifolia]|nr:hypothetical protein FB451DRAFT_1313450 [Mycena latifolia]
MPVHRMLSRLVVLIIDCDAEHHTHTVLATRTPWRTIHEGFRPSVVGGGVGVSCIGIPTNGGFSFPAEEITSLSAPGFVRASRKKGCASGNDFFRVV